MIQLIRTNSKNPEFKKLVSLLDEDLSRRDGPEHTFYAQFNKIDVLSHVVIAYDNEKPIACGAMKQFDKDSMEIKRMYTLPEFRGKGVAARILKELELWSFELNYLRCVLETGKRQPEAVALYRKWGYDPIPNYGQYAGIDNSLCFEKKIPK